jgi:hypothetical protein
VAPPPSCAELRQACVLPRPRPQDFVFCPKFFFPRHESCGTVCARDARACLPLMPGPTPSRLHLQVTSRLQLPHHRPHFFFSNKGCCSRSPAARRAAARCALATPPRCLPLMPGPKPSRLHVYVGTFNKTGRHKQHVYVHFPLRDRARRCSLLGFAASLSRQGGAIKARKDLKLALCGGKSQSRMRPGR